MIGMIETEQLSCAVALRARLAIAAVAIALGVAGCGSSPMAPSTTFSTTDLVVGTGATAENGKTVTVNYTGWLYDSSRPSNLGGTFGTTVGGTPFTFVLGSGVAIPGFEQGVLGMKVGGLRRVVVPPELAYGAAGAGPIPPNWPIIFDVSLVAVQ